MAGETASIEIRRALNRWTDRARVYEVVVDDLVAGRVAYGKSSSFEVAAGSHEIFMKIDWCRSEKVILDLVPGQKAFLDCSARNPFTGLYWITFGRRRHIKLTRVTVAGTPGQSPPADWRGPNGR
jgi:hypothetical protein